MITIARPALNAVPTSWVDNAWITTWPRPGAAISAAMVTIASAAMMVWLMPSTMVRLAIGSSAPNNSWDRVAPSDSTASRDSEGTDRMPCAVSRMTGGAA